MDDNPAVTVPAVSRLRSNQQSPSNDDDHMDNNPAVQRVRTTEPLPLKDQTTQTSGLQKITTKRSRGNSSLISMPAKYNQGWRRIVRNFSPSWFSVTMGTGIVSTILITIPFKADWLYYLSIIFFVLNVALFSLAMFASILRYTIWPEIWTVMIEDATNSLFLGTIPMGFATLVEMWIFVCVPAWGEWAVYVAWAMWMLDSIIAVTITVSLGVLLMSASHQRSLDTITAGQLLPIAATIVAAGTGAEVAAVLPNPHQALGTLIASYTMWGMATPMAMSVLVIYYQRLALHKLPPREIIVSAFLPVGPLGFGGYTILYLGKQAAIVFPKTGAIEPLAGRMAHVLGFLVALVMWGWGLVWLVFALAAIYKARPFPFNMGWWGFIFPLGVYSVSTILLGEELPSKFFRVLGTIFATIVIILWVFVAAKTAEGAWQGHLFHAPCLANLRRERRVAAERSGGEAEKEVGGGGDGQVQGSDVADWQTIALQDSREAPDIAR